MQHICTYAEAVRKVGVQANGSNVKVPDRQEKRACEGCRGIKEDTLVVEKMQFILFMVEVINCTAQITDKKTEKIKIIVKAAEKFLGVEAIGWEEVEDELKGGSPSSQAPSQSSVGGGGSSWS